MNKQTAYPRFLASIFILTLLVSFIPVRIAHAATITTITVSAGSLDADLGKSLSVCTLREAIRAINTHSSYDGCIADASTNRIVLPAGNFLLTRDGSDEDGAWSGDLDILTNVTIIGAKSGTSIYVDSHNHPFADRIFHIGSSSLPTITVTIKNLTIAGGYAHDDLGGGGILNENANLTLNGVVFRDNEASDGRGGGGVMNSASSTLTVDNTTFDSNLASLGGGIYNRGNAIITNSLFVRNTAMNAGGGLNNDPPRGTGYLKMKNVTIANNESLDDDTGAGLDNSGILELTNVTIARNSGVGLYLNGDIGLPYTATVRNTLIAYHAPDAGCQMQELTTKFITGGYNLIDSTVNNDPENILCTFNSGGVTTDITDVDPLLSAELVTILGSSTQTFDFSDINSAAVDAIPTDDPYCLPNDQLMHRRPVDGNGGGSNGCDIGAYELGGTPLATDVYLPMVRR